MDTVYIRVCALFAALCCMLVLSACGDGGGEGGGEDVSEPSATSPASSATASSSGRLASSLGGYLQGFVDNRRAQMSDAQYDILARSARNGSISRADYEEAWNNYKQCMVDKGYTEPVLVEYANGIYDYPLTNATGMSDEQIAKLNEDDPSCMFSEIGVVKSAYNVQVGNPGLLRDTDEAIVDCLHRTGRVPEGYTKEQWGKEAAKARFSEEPASEAYSFDVDDPQILGCLAAFGYSPYQPDEDGMWYPLGRPGATTGAN